MRHLNKVKKLGRTASHRHAMLGNLAVSILDKEHVVTTVQKAKVVRSVVDRLISYGKKGDLHSIRLAARTIHDKVVLKKLFSDIAPGYKTREGGYTRILKLEERKGDKALMSIIELVGRNSGELARKRKKSAAAEVVAGGKPVATATEKETTKK